MLTRMRTVKSVRKSYAPHVGQPFLDYSETSPAPFPPSSTSIIHLLPLYALSYSKLTAHILLFFNGGDKIDVGPILIKNDLYSQKLRVVSHDVCDGFHSCFGPWPRV